MIFDVTGILLAGGKSQRMGEDKRFLPVGKYTLLERSTTILRSLFEQLYIVIAQDGAVLQTDTLVIRDLIPDCGSLGGLYTGLRKATTPHIFVAACDMPFLNPTVIHYMVAIKDSADIVMPRWKNRLHPTHALYSQRCLPAIETMLHGHDVKIQNVLADPTLRIRFISEDEIISIDPTGRSLVNINTPDDLEMARSLGNDTPSPQQ